MGDLNNKYFIGFYFLSALADSAVGETEHLKREIAYLESQIPGDDANREIENQIREQTGNRFLLKIKLLLKSFL